MKSPAARNGLWHAMGRVGPFDDHSSFFANPALPQPLPQHLLVQPLSIDKGCVESITARVPPCVPKRLGFIQRILVVATNDERADFTLHASKGNTGNRSVKCRGHQTIPLGRFLNPQQLPLNRQGDKK